MSHAEVYGIRRNGTEFIVDHSAGSSSAPHLVVATGPWLRKTLALRGHDVAVDPVAIQMIVTEATPRAITPVLIQHIGEGLSVKQVHAGNLLIGGGWPAAPFHDTGRQEISFKSLSGNIRQAMRILPEVGELRVLRTWAGPLAAARDEMPIVGEVTEDPGLYVAGGTYGVTFAPLWARHIGDLIEKRETTIDVTDLSPRRLNLMGVR